MISSRLAALLALAAALAACSTPQSRIKHHQAEFDAYPPDVRQKIAAGEADVGFTREQVALALGRPDRRYTRKGIAGDQEVWLYGLGSGEPRVSLGFGMGMGGPGFYGGGMGLATDVGGEPDPYGGARTRVTFEGDKAVRVDSRRD